MKVVWVAVLVTLILVVQTEAKKKPKGKKPGKPKPTGKCPVDSTSTKQFEKFTVTKKVGGKTKPQADQVCWWNASLNECAKCKPGGIQCGFPMHKWCQSKKSRVGCKGIPNYKYTLSAAGYPCYWDTKSLKCAWCAPKRVQCKDSAQAQKCGSYCEPATSLKCDGVLTTCNNIPKCGFGASCDKPTGKCKCAKGLVGNGFQCFDATSGEQATNPNGNVEISIDSESKFFIYPHESEEFPNA